MKIQEDTHYAAENSLRDALYKKSEARLTANVLKENQNTQKVISDCVFFSPPNTTRQCANFPGISSSSGKRAHKQHLSHGNEKLMILIFCGENQTWDGGRAMGHDVSDRCHRAIFLHTKAFFFNVCCLCF